jgi:gluconokinase
VSWWLNCFGGFGGFMVIILMGVTGSGKTTIGQKLAAVLSCPFFDADEHHSLASREKMSRGEPLTEEDRKPWLESLAVKIREWNKKDPLTVLACSALKQSYRDLLSNGEVVHWVYLKGDRELIRRRLEGRQGHFADARLLESQFALLEEPRNAMVVDIGEESDKLVNRLKQTI